MPVDFVSSKSVLFDGDVVTHGQSSAGKTWFAASISKFWPEEVKPGQMPAWVALEDMAWLAFDAGACDGFMTIKVEIPYIISALDIIAAAPNTIKATTDMKAFLRARMPEMVKKGVKWLVIDTVSSLDKLVQAHFEEGAGEDGRMMYRKILQFHTTWRNDLRNISRACGFKLHYLAHSKAQQEDAKTPDGTKKAHQAQRVAGGGDVLIDVVGQSRSPYINNSSLVGPLKLVHTPGKPDVRTFHPMGQGPFEGKNRFQGILLDAEPAHLGKIYNKLLKAAE